MRPFACDIILIEDKKILLIRRANPPFKGEWALPGGMIEDGESSEECAAREMLEETGLKVEIVELSGLYSDPNRDPRGVIAAAYMARRVGGALKAGDDAGGAAWFALDDLPKLAADHSRIIKEATEARF